MLPGRWENTLLDYDRDAEFSGDDVNRVSEVCDLGAPFEFVQVQIPSIDSATVTIHNAVDKAKATVPKALVQLSQSAAGHFAPATTAGTGLISVIFRIGGVQFIRIVTGADQTANRTFQCRGFNSF
jgi:hypothetical protein